MPAPTLVIVVEIHKRDAIESSIAGDAAVGLAIIDAFESVGEREELFEFDDEVVPGIGGEVGWRLTDPFYPRAGRDAALAGCGR